MIPNRRTAQQKVAEISDEIVLKKQGARAE
jgi:hypothetical protein